jgi:radical SAM superfamily enzyme YgiQ (UPF0313 family)
MHVTLVSLNTNSSHYSLGIAVLAAYLRRMLPAVIVESKNYSLAQSDRYILLDLAESPAQLVGFSVQYGNAHRVIAIATALKAAYPEYTIVFGGTDVGLLLGGVLPPGVVTAVAFGEGERTLLDATRALAEGRTLEGIPGLGLVTGSHLEPPAAPRPYSEHLDEFPSPYLDGTFRDFDKYPAVFLETYRGCAQHAPATPNSLGDSHNRVARGSDVDLESGLTEAGMIREKPRERRHDLGLNRPL